MTLVVCALEEMICEAILVSTISQLARCYWHFWADDSRFVEVALCIGGEFSNPKSSTTRYLIYQFTV